MRGKKGRAGLERILDKAYARELLEEAVPDARQKFIDRLVDTALGDGPHKAEAAQLLLFYTFGPPAHESDGADE